MVEVTKNNLTLDEDFLDAVVEDDENDVVVAVGTEFVVVMDAKIVHKYQQKNNLK